MNKKYFFLGIAVFLVLASGSCKKSQENQNSRPEEFGAAEAEPNPVYWVVESLRLREEPKTNGKEIQTMPKGTMVVKLDTGDEAAINYITGNWLYVQTEDETKGWCFGGYLADTKEKAIITGYWIDGRERLILDLNTTGVYTSGRLVSGGKLGKQSYNSEIFGAWSYTGGNTIRIDVTGVNYKEEEYSFDMPFTILDNGKVQFGDIVYRQITAKELRSFGIR